MMLEMKLILGIDHLTPLADNLTNFFEAIASLKPGGKEVFAFFFFEAHVQLEFSAAYKRGY